MARNGILSLRQGRFIAALLEAPSIRGACALADIGERTGWRYLQDALVRAELSRRQDAMLAQATAQIAQDMTAALDTLREIMASKSATDTSRVSAARAILGYALQLIEMRDLAERVARLEEKQREQKP